jgi:hypothetical protein
VTLDYAAGDGAARLKASGYTATVSHLPVTKLPPGGGNVAAECDSADAPRGARMTAVSAPVIRSTGGPVAADDTDQRVREWCRLLGIPFADLSAKEDPE